jgi:glutathione peroxidase
MRFLLPLLSAVALSAAASSTPAHAGAPMSLYDLQAHTLEGESAPLSAYAGKVSLVVNLASKCGYTPQYAGLEALYKKYAARGFVILGFPSNEFGGQEPGAAPEIRSFCQLTYGVDFPLFEKSVTKPGAAQSPVYGFLTQGREAPAWNFSKYLVGKDGAVVAFYPSKVTPEDPGLVAAIEAALAK